MRMQNCLKISREDLNYNARAVIDYVKTPVIAVVKCDGYGITMQYAVQAWYDNGVRFFAVAEPWEAFTIRELGFDDVDILLMTPVWDEDILLSLAKCGVIFTVADKRDALRLVNTCGEYNPRAHVKINTGMGRFGSPWDDIGAISDIYNVEGIRFEGIFSHFAASFEKKYKLTEQQYLRFMTVIAALENEKINVGMRHIANSCAAIRFPDTRLDAVRIGSALVGRLVTSTELELKKIGVLQAEVVDEVQLKKGDTTGYAAICKIKKPTRAVIAAIGYRQGFGLVRRDDSFRFTDVLRSIYHSLRSYKKQPIVRHSGKRFKVLGRVGNQYTLIKDNKNLLKKGDFIEADVNILVVDSSVPRVLE